MIGDTLEILPVSETETMLRLVRGRLIVEGLWRGNPKHATRMLPQLRAVLHEQWRKGPPAEVTC